MKTGDIVLDGQGTRYQVALPLGRGLWARTYRVRRLDDGADLVLKCALTANDFPADTPDLERLEGACREALDEQVRLLRQPGHPFLPRLEDAFTTRDGEHVMVIAHLPGSLEQRLSAGACFGECVDILVRALRSSQQLRDSPGFHGALRPTNILLGEKGEVVLSDVATPSSRRVVSRLLPFLDDPLRTLPPEVTEATTEPPFAPQVDTYAAGMILWRAAMGGERALPRNGLDRVGIVTLKDRLHARIRQEDSNPRFHGRLADRVAAVVERAISLRATPSPPYRFTRIDEMIPRLEEILALIRPVVNQLGRVMLDRPPHDPTFATGEPVRFSVGVTTSAGVENHEDLACGIAIFNQDTGTRLREVPCTYDVTRHPPGRFRYVFTLERMPPGTWRIRLAFAVRDSGQEPAAREVEIRVRAAPGYVPPYEEPRHEPIPIERAVEPREDTLPGLAGPRGTQERPPPVAAAPPAARTVPPPEPPTTPARPTPARPAPLPGIPPRTHLKGGRVEDTMEEYVSPTPPGRPSRPAVPPSRTPEIPPASRPAGPPPATRPPPLDAAPLPVVPKPTEETAGRTLVPVEPPPKASEPSPTGTPEAGRWEPLPLSPASDRSIVDLPEVTTDDGSLPDLRPAWSRAFDLVRGDAYFIFMVVAFGIILLLTALLLLLRH
ncbi:MAG: hypothetical protein JXB39_02570 [Deltaproteobacteria bacterium]|nr:hypothetical protein [Deltaproteobacteria bacterium]